VPGDVAVTGMDDIEIGRVFLPSLTSVSLGSPGRGRAAVELILGLTDDPDQPAQQVAVGPELIVRGSTVDEVDS
jgi:LacI family transcriptional regulator